MDSDGEIEQTSPSPKLCPLLLLLHAYRTTTNQVEVWRVRGHDLLVPEILNSRQLHDLVTYKRLALFSHEQHAPSFTVHKQEQEQEQGDEKGLKRIARMASWHRGPSGACKPNCIQKKDQLPPESSVLCVSLS